MRNTDINKDKLLQEEGLSQMDAKLLIDFFTLLAEWDMAAKQKRTVPVSKNIDGCLSTQRGDNE